ncbi:MAG: hypothetical protein J4F40_10305 [Alphaproteobacteria bacterium]|nr:hypothetical protein [Alphaproteobacteria bacterium]
MLNRTVMTGAAPSIVLLVVLLMTGVVGVGEGVTVIALIIAGAVWTARRTETLTPVPPAETPVDTEPVERRILDELPDPVILLSASRNIISANQAARKLFNITEMGRDLTIALRHPAVLDAVDLSLAGSTPDPVEFELVAGVPVTFEVQVAAVPRPNDEDGVRVVVLLHDVTGTKRVDEVRADFVANVSHELRSPLAALAGFIETLSGPAKDDPAAREKFLGIMNNEAQRMTRLIEDLLSLSRVEANEHIRPEDEVELETVIGEVVDTYSNRCTESGNSIDVDLPDDLPSVLGDHDQLSQVFQNLIDNALKYGGPGKPVRVTASPVERLPESGTHGVAVSVQDQGDGIPTDHIPRLTERFYRVDKARSRGLGGTGLGLAIVKHIVSRHRGHILIESTPESGSTFTVTVPTFSQDPQDLSDR